MAHIAVLKREVLEYLDVAPGKNFVDCTIGEGRHTAVILKKNGPDGKVLGIELDPGLYKKLEETEIKNRLILVNDSYTNLEKIIKKEKFGPMHGILFDLGLSSWHLEESGRGFSFLRDEPLDMRYNAKCQIPNSKYQKLTAAKIVNRWTESEIEKVLRIYGEERFSKRIVKEIVKERKIRPIKTTFQLVKAIKRAVPKKYEKGRIHPATRTFQALRIAVNDELKNLKETLPQALNVLEPGARNTITQRMTQMQCQHKIQAQQTRGPKIVRQAKFGQGGLCTHPLKANTIFFGFLSPHLTGKYDEDRKAKHCCVTASVTTVLPTVTAYTTEHSIPSHLIPSHPIQIQSIQ